MQIFTIINKRVMKSLIKVFIVISCLCVCSCSQYIQVLVSGKPGTVIKEPNGNVVGTIGNDGSTKIDLQRNPHYAFLLSNNPVQGTDVPFALEFKTNTRKRTADWVGYWILLPTGIGALAALPIAFNLGDDDVEHCYDYIPSQTNEDLNIIQ